MRRFFSGVAVAAVLAGLPLTSSASATSTRRTPSVTASVPSRDVTEGDVVPVTVKVGAASAARKVQLQELQTPTYPAVPTWVTIDSQRVRERRTHTFQVVPTLENQERYRALVTYRKDSPVHSKPVTLTVWRWIPLVSYDAYYSTPGILAGPYWSFAMNGAEYQGWQTYGDLASWENRYTPGRHCKELAGDLGVQDTSDDGSSATIAVADEDGAVLYQSGALTPGMVERMELPLDLPYRFAIRATDTSPEGVHSLPAIGDPELLCTGV